MCCGILFTEVVFLALYTLTAPALTAASGPHLLLHLYLIYTGYSFLGAALGNLSPFLREVIQVCCCGCVLVCYPLTLLPAPLLDLLGTLLLLASPLLSLIEGYSLYKLITKTSQTITAHIDDNENLVKTSVIVISLSSLAVSAYLNIVYIDLHPSTKLLIFSLLLFLIITNVVLEQGVISDACLLTMVTYIILTAALTADTGVNKFPTFSGAPQASTMLGAIVRMPHIISYSVSSVVPYVKQLMSPVPLSLLTMRVITVASFSDSHLDEESIVRRLGKFFIVTLYTSYILGATQTTPWLHSFSVLCRCAEVGIMNTAYLAYLLGYTAEMDESF